VNDAAGSTELDPKRYTVLVVDDEQDNLDAFRFNFRRAFTLRYATSGDEALQVVRGEDVAVIVADQRMPGMTGVELLAQAAAARPGVVGILVTAYTDLGVLVDALNSGHVYRYVAKPWDSKELRVVLRQALETYHLRRENRRLLDRLEELTSYLDGEVRRETRAGRIVGESKALQEVLATVRNVAGTSSTVLVRGESGTGKELVARAIHDESERSGSAFVRVACGALSPGVLESELFGHEKGAFTGAVQRKLGRFELAHGGTLFLDEVGDLPAETQIKLLRVLQEKELERVGGTETLSVDVRVVSATHRDLETLVEQGSFREDLYYRLNVFPITLPPLRERIEDIPLLADHFRSIYAAEHRRPVESISDEALARLVAWRWPGNVRELCNVIERAVIRATDGVIGPEIVDVSPPSARPQPEEGTARGERLPEVLDDLERAELVRALHEAGGQKAEAARALGINRTTLYYRLRKHGLA